MDSRLLEPGVRVRFVSERPSRAAALKDQRERMWRHDPRCHWCGCLTVLPPVDCGPHRKHVPDNEATIDHLDSRWSSERGKHEGNYRRVLACRDCNHRRGRADEAATPIQELWERSGAFTGIARLAGALPGELAA